MHLLDQDGGGAPVILSLSPVAFSNFGASSSIAACTPMVLNTLISTADTKLVREQQSRGGRCTACRKFHVSLPRVYCC
jgi:hypothetical protein